MAALGNSDAAERHAAKALAVYPRDFQSLAIVRNADLGRGDPMAARARYASAWPELLSTTPLVNTGNCIAALDLALVLQGTGELARASTLLGASENQLRGLARLGWSGYGIADAQIYALRGQKTQALAALRGAVQVGWRGPMWRYYRDIDPALASIRNEPEFNAVFTDIERDMARQRAALAARPKDAPLDLAGTGT